MTPLRQPRRPPATAAKSPASLVRAVRPSGGRLFSSGRVPNRTGEHRTGGVLPWRSSVSLNGRGAESCLVRFGLGDTSQRPVRQFLSATPVSLRWPFRTVFSRRLPEGIVGHEIRRNHPVGPPCVPHRHVRRALSGIRRRGAVRTPSPLPVSPEGDHFPRTPMMKICVVSPPPAPVPPRRHACRCIRDGTGRL